MQHPGIVLTNGHMRMTIQSELEDCATASSDPTQGGMGTSVLLVDAIPELRLNRRSPRNYAKVCFRYFKLQWISLLRAILEFSSVTSRL